MISINLLLSVLFIGKKRALYKIYINNWYILCSIQFLCHMEQMS